MPGTTTHGLKLVSWYFEPSQPQRMTSGLKQIFNLSPIYSAHVIKPQILPKNPTESVPTQIYIKQNVHKHQTQHFRRISPFSIAPVKKNIYKNFLKKTRKARTR